MLRLLPILGVLMAIVLLLVLLAVTVVLVMRSRSNAANAAAVARSRNGSCASGAGGRTEATHVAFNTALEEEVLMTAAMAPANMTSSPDVIPQRPSGKLLQSQC